MKKLYSSSKSNNGTNTSLFYLNANNDSSNSNTNIGSQLLSVDVTSLSVTTSCNLTSWWKIKDDLVSTVEKRLEITNGVNQQRYEILS